MKKAILGMALVTLAMLPLFTVAFQETVWYPLKDGNDTAGNYNLTTLSSAAYVTPGIAGSPYALSVTNGYAQTNATFTFLLGNASHSITYWVNLRALPGGLTNAYHVGVGKNNGNSAFFAGLANPVSTPVYRVGWITSGAVWDNVSWATGRTYFIAATYESASNLYRLYVDGSFIGTQTGGANFTSGSQYIEIGSSIDLSSSEKSNGNYSDVRFFANKTLTQSEVSELYNNGVYDSLPLGGGNQALNISNINNTDSGIATPPYITFDTTPTFSFLTNTLAMCRISAQNQTFAQMAANKTCNTGENMTSHICTLTPQDELTTGNAFVFLGCAASTNQSNTLTVPLQMQITGLAQNSSAAIVQGIRISLGQAATVYTYQQVYMRSVGDNQKVGTADAVAVYGSQRWVFHYYNETGSPVGFFNITPAVYSLEIFNKTLTNIPSIVSGFINSTKQ